jgi:hypothetical protein
MDFGEDLGRILEIEASVPKRLVPLGGIVFDANAAPLVVWKYTLGSPAMPVRVRNNLVGASTPTSRRAFT